MRLTGCKKLIIALLLLAFTSQSMAAVVMSCQLAAQHSVSPSSMDEDMSMMDMSDADMADMNHAMSMQSDKKADCCKTMGHCLSGSCTLTGLSNSITISFAAVGSHAFDSYTSAQPLPLISSLYRPPISR